ncbi:MAG: ATP-dependent DNA helicase RecQ [bacterium]
MQPNSIQQTLSTTFGFESFRPGQIEVISRLMEGKSVLAVFPTGSGKSLCYQLPALLLNGLTLVVSPLIALMKDQIDFLTSKGINAARLDSSLTLEETRKVWENLREKKLRLLYVAPERFSNERFLQSLSHRDISLMVIDEAHCISEWGHNFRPDYLKLRQISQDLKVKSVLTLTATATPSVAKDIQQSFRINEEDYINTGCYRPNLTLRITPCPKVRRDQLLIERLQQRKPGSTIIYVTLQRTSEEVAADLQQHGFEAKAYHAGMAGEERHQVQDWFMNSNQAIVVATIAFGMGIDKSNIRYVYHYNLPKGLENYSQEIGRAGRDGLESICELLACPDDVITLENFSYGDTPTPETIRAIITEIVSYPEVFDISLSTMSITYDIRILVLSTLLTYLELEGVITATGPFYNSYQFQPCRPSKEILSRFDKDRAQFLQTLFSRAEKKKTWFDLDITRTAKNMQERRERLVAALNYLEEQGDIILKVSGVRQGYRIVKLPNNPEILIKKLAERFLAAEKRDIGRIKSVLNLAQQKDCIVRDLVSYFGEKFDQPCGHCDRCLGEKIPPLTPLPQASLEKQEEKILRSILEERQSALKTPRQFARFLCGLPSPATSYGRPPLSRHRYFGCFSGVPFQRVLDFVELSL